MLDDPAARQGHGGAKLAGDRIVEREPGVAVLVRDHEHVAATLVDAAIEVPRRRVQELSVDDDAKGVAALVRREQDTSAQPLHGEVLGGALVRRQVLDGAGSRVTEVDVAVTGLGPDPLDRDLRAVGRYRLDAAVAADLEDVLLPAFELACDDIEVDAVAAVRRVREDLSADAWRAVDEPRVHDELLE